VYTVLGKDIIRYRVKANIADHNTRFLFNLSCGAVFK